MAHRNRLRRHRPHRRPGPPRPTRHLAPRPLVHRGAPALGTRRDLCRRPLTDPHRQRPTGHGHPTEPRHQPAPAGRRHQHRQSAAASRPRHQAPTHTATDQLICHRHTASRTLPRPWARGSHGSTASLHRRACAGSCRTLPTRRYTNRYTLDMPATATAAKKATTRKRTYRPRAAAADPATTTAATTKSTAAAKSGRSRAKTAPAKTGPTEPPPSQARKAPPGATSATQIDFRADEETRQALDILTQDGTPVSEPIRSAIRLAVWRLSLIHI